MKKKSLLSTWLLLFTLSPIFAQTPGTIRLETIYFNNYEVFYIGDFDFNNGMNNPDIFKYSLVYEPNDGDGSPGSGTPLNVSIEFEMIANVPGLNLNNRRIVYIITNPFAFNGEVSISTRDLDLNMNHLYYTDGREVTGISIRESEYLSEGEFANIKSVVMATGKLPSGDYIFNFTVYPENATGMAPLSQHQVVSVANPTTIDLVAPGGALADNIEIFSMYPLFQWESIDFMWTGHICPECGYWIRVSEYNPSLHSSLDEALNDNSNIPYPDNGQFYHLPAELVADGTDLYTARSSFQFPFTDSKPLEEGKTYVWQLKKTYPTTSGSETVESNIFVFTIPSMGGEEGTGGTTASAGSENIYVQILEQLIDPETYNQLFAGELLGYLPTGVVTLNDTQQLTQDQLSAIAAQLLAGQITVESITVE